MKMRSLGRCGLFASEVGLGCEHLQGQDRGTVEAVVRQALDLGVNILDVFMSEPQVRDNLGHALRGRRQEVLLQGHIGAAWVDGQYLRTRERKLTETFFEDFLTRLDTDYVDLGMLHFVDTEEDYRSVFDTDILEYALRLKEQGAIRALGMSSHNPEIALRAVKSGALDVLLFSVNPAYDLLPATVDIDGMFQAETYQNSAFRGTDPVRAELYSTCEAMGVGITVMKGLGAGVLLNPQLSPFGAALTEHQCIHYCLTRPGVASVLVGCRTPEEVRAAVSYEEAAPEERDFSTVLGATPRYSLQGHCMYCNHCLPCPAEIDIAAVNKYLDLAKTAERVPDTVRAHYDALPQNAADCIACGACEERCPFAVPVRARMEDARKLFG